MRLKLPFSLLLTINRCNRVQRCYEFLFILNAIDVGIRINIVAIVKIHSMISEFSLIIKGRLTNAVSSTKALVEFG